MESKKIIGAIAVLGLLLGVVNWFQPNLPTKELLSNDFAGAPGNLLAEDYDPYILYNGGFNTAKDFSVSGVTSLSGATTLSGTISTTGILTTNAGNIKSYTNASSSVTTGTLKQSDILNYDTVLWTPTGANSTKTLTFPASSTLTSFIPSAGDRQSTCFFNATTTAATTITYAAGTGIDLEVATSTAQTGAFDLVQSADAMMCFEFLRKTNTDIVAGYVEYNDAD